MHRISGKQFVKGRQLTKTWSSRPQRIHYIYLSFSTLLICFCVSSTGFLVVLSSSNIHSTSTSRTRQFSTSLSENHRHEKHPRKNILSFREHSTLTKMMYDWVWLLTLCCLVTAAQSLMTNLAEDGKKTEQTMRPKLKRTQEMLMFGNQQNRQADSKTATSYSSTAEKRTLASAGLGGLKAALVEEEKSSRSNTPNNAMYDRDSFPPYEKNYDYSKVLVNELGDEMPQVWDVPTYSRYYLNEDRRKRSEKSGIIGSTTMKPSTSAFQSSTSTQQSVSQAQAKRSVPIYQEPRFKRELDIDPEDVLTLLSLWENERRKRNWHKYMNDEYENVDDEDNLLDEEDPRNVIPWMDSPVYPPRHYSLDSLSPSDIGIIRTHPSSYYEQYENQYGQQYDGTSQYGSPQYGLVYPQQSYYNLPEKRFMVSRKRSQAYDPYSAQYQISSQSRGYPYQHRLVY